MHVCKNILKYPLWLLLSFIGCLSPTTLPAPCDCPAPDYVKVENITPTSAVISWVASAGDYTLSLQNIENQQSTTYTYSASGAGFFTISDTLTNLDAATTYAVQTQRSCNRGCPFSYSEASPLQLFSTEDTGPVCAAPFTFSMFHVKGDTLWFTWQSLPSATDFRLYVADSVGNIVYQQNFTPFIGNPLNLYIQKTNLPAGDYTAWMETTCGQASSLPSNMAVFRVHAGGGGPVVVIEDDISLYKDINNIYSQIYLPDVSLDNNCTQERTISLLNTQNPKQLIVGYRIDNNANALCAPINPAYWRITSYRVNGVQVSQSLPHYTISTPRIHCLCPNEVYKISFVARGSYLPLSTMNIISQNCPLCP
jgi:hypothetical protein